MSETGVTSSEKVGLFQIVVLLLSIVVLGALAVDTIFKLPREISDLLQTFDTLVCVFLITDFGIRFYKAQSKLVFLKWGWIDLVASIPNLSILRVGRLVRILRIIRLLRAIEAKAICHELNNAHITQAVGYASTKGIEWVVLTNGIIWQIYKVTIDKSVDHEKIVEIDFLNLDHHNSDHLESVFRLTKEGWMKSVLNDFYEQKQALSKFSIAAILSTDSVLSVIRKNLKLISPDAKINAEQIRSVLEKEVIIEGILKDEKADEARRKIAKALKRAEKESIDESSPGAVQPIQNPSPKTCLPSVSSIPISPSAN